MASRSPIKECKSPAFGLLEIIPNPRHIYLLTSINPSPPPHHPPLGTNKHHAAPAVARRGPRGHGRGPRARHGAPHSRGRPDPRRQQLLAREQLLARQQLVAPRGRRGAGRAGLLRSHRRGEDPQPAVPLDVAAARPGLRGEDAAEAAEAARPAAGLGHEAAAGAPGAAPAPAVGLVVDAAAGAQGAEAGAGGAAS